MENFSLTKEEKGKYLEFINAAANKACVQIGFDKNGIQRLIENNDKFQQSFFQIINQLIESKKFGDEEMSSEYFPVCVEKYKPVGEQIKLLAKILNLDPTYAFNFAKNLPSLKSFAPGYPKYERIWQIGWFAVTTADVLVKKYFPKVIMKYCHAVRFINKKIGTANGIIQEVPIELLRINERTVQAYKLIDKMQKGDIKIIAAQLGMLHPGKSVRRVYETLAINEFGLESIASGCILLTHPEKFTPPNLNNLDDWNLGMTCIGNEFPSKDHKLSVPFYKLHYDNKLHYDGYKIDEKIEFSGAATGFLPPF